MDKRAGASPAPSPSTQTKAAPSRREFLRTALLGALALPGLAEAATPATTARPTTLKPASPGATTARPTTRKPTSPGPSTAKPTTRKPTTRPHAATPSEEGERLASAPLAPDVRALEEFPVPVRVKLPRGS